MIKDESNQCFAGKYRPMRVVGSTSLYAMRLRPRLLQVQWANLPDAWNLIIFDSKDLT